MKSILYLLLFCCSIGLTAQQLPESSAFLNTNFAVNPALTATSDYLEAHVLYRRQWTGFDQAPRTISAGLQCPIVQQNMALGLHISQDQVGVMQQTDISLNYAYHVPIASGQRLSFGAAVHFGQYRFKEDDIIATDEGDAFFIEGEATQFQTNAGIGFSYATMGVNEYDKSHFFLSLGANQIVPNDLIFSDLSKLANFRRVLHVAGALGYRFQADYSYLEPSLQVNYVAGNVSNYRFQLNYEMADTFWAGVALDSNVRFAFQGGVIINERADGQLRIGALASYGASNFTQEQGVGYSFFAGYSFGL